MKPNMTVALVRMPVPVRDPCLESQGFFKEKGAVPGTPAYETGEATAEM
jgi:hypothetical protein